MKEGYKKTELGWIPESWGIVSLGEITENHKQGYYTKDKYSNNGTYLARITDLNNPKINYQEMPKLEVDKDVIEQYKIKEGDFLFARSGAIGRYGIYKSNYPEMIFASYIIKFKFNNDKIFNEYIGYFYESEYSQKQLKAITQGSSNININANNIKSLLICIPSLKEQQKIVEILSTVDLQIDDTNKLIEKTKELKKGLMQRLLTKGIGHSEFKKSEVGEIPVEWEVKKFNEIISKLTDYHSNGSYKSLKENVELLDERDYAVMVRITNLSNGKKDDFKYITKQAYEFLDKSKLMKDDIVMSKISDAGSVYLVPDFNMPMSLAMNLFLIRTTEENKFYYYYLKYKEEYVKSFSSGTATTTITKEDVKNILVPVMDKREQKKIAEILFDIDNQIDEYRNKKTKLEELKKGLMQQLLTGKIRVV